MEQVTYSKTGVDVSHTDSIKREMAVYLESSNNRVLNALGPFASLYDISFDDIKNPVLVMKNEEPGSKQKLATEYGFEESVCHDLVNHLVNDIIVMGAKPLAVLDTIVCGRADKDTITTFIKGISEACRNNECDLVGGETSVQPGVVDDGIYILSASVAGIVDRNKIIDGSAIKEGDKIIALASNGLHTNGYTLVRHLIDTKPEILNEKIGNDTFIQAIMKPHTAYYKTVKNLFGKDMIHGMAHITGGGIEGNLPRVLPRGMSAVINLGSIKVPPVFNVIKSYGNVPDDDMLKTFNCGAGLIIIVPESSKNAVSDEVSKICECYEIGEIVKGDKPVDFQGRLNI